MYPQRGEFRGPFEVDAFGTFAVSRFAARDMRTRRWGRIINVGDISAQTGLLGGTNVAAAKGAILGMTYTWAAELGRWGITANCVIPEAYSRLHDPLYRKAIELAQLRGDTEGRLGLVGEVLRLQAQGHENDSGENVY